jgi:hypothetical protein
MSTPNTPGPWYYKNGMVASETTGTTVATVENPADGYIMAEALNMRLKLYELAEQIEDSPTGQCRYGEGPLIRQILYETLGE